MIPAGSYGRVLAVSMSRGLTDLIQWERYWAVQKSDDVQRAARHWDARAKRSNSVMVRWWQCPQILRHINRKLSGEPVDGFAGGLRAWLARELGGRVLTRGISVGCGNGAKEMGLLKAGLVERFDLFEISQVRISQGISLAESQGLSDRVSFFLKDAFETERKARYDLVYWDNALHHMPDARAACEWSRQVLCPGGYIVVNDYIGADRFQHSDRALDYASRVRRSFPGKFLENGARPGAFVPERVTRIDRDRLIAQDPSEAADSARIVGEVSRLFPGGRWIMLGGVIYHTGLNDIIWNFDRYGAGGLLDGCLIVDDLLSDLGENEYGAFMAQV